MSKYRNQTAGLPMFTADHDGKKTYDSRRDKPRLNAQMRDVYRAMKDSQWRTLRDVARLTGHPEASISARLRDLRKPKFGGHVVERRHMGDGVWAYRMIPKHERGEG